MQNFNILITGANGQLGSEFREIAEIQSLHTFFFTDVDDLDITDFIAVNKYIIENNIDIIVNCAAYTAVDKAEEEVEIAENINVLGPEILAKSANINSCKLVHISTDYVFDGSKNMPYTEDDIEKPIGVYGATKYKGEQAVIAINAEAVVIRTSWLYSSFGNNFVKTMLKFGKERESVNVICDQVGTPTYAKDLAVAILKILDSGNKINRKRSVYHFSNQGVISWYDFAVNIMELAKLDCKVNAIETKDYPSKVVRPFYSVLNKANMIKDFNLEIPYWKESLKDCINKLNN